MKKTEVVIIYPDSLGTVEPNKLKLIEKFIDILILSDSSKTNISVKSNERYVESNDGNVKNYINLLQKTNQLSSFAMVLEKITHVHEKNADLKLIKCAIGNNKIQLIIKNLKDFPDLQYEIERKSVEFDG